MRTALILISLLAALPAQSNAQWQIVTPAPTTADLRGIDNVGKGVAWASGSDGTVLRTEDAGYLWQRCSIPPGAAHLDFRAVQAFDANTAIVMSSGKGPLSRLYKTTDGCQTWTLLATNPDKDGFWDSVKAYNEAMPANEQEVLILGDSVNGKLRLWEWKEGWEDRELELSYQARGSAAVGEGSFAASNSVLQIASTKQTDKTWKYSFRWASGTADQAYVSYVRDESTPTCEPCREERGRIDVPLASGSTTAGIFSFFFRSEFSGVAVGGDFVKPDSATKNCAWTNDAGQHWQPATTPPHGFRSAVAYDAASKTWITVGPNGTDISTDDGRNWRALRPDPKLGDAPDADQHWNALSLPFAVGPHGRIGILRPAALTPIAKEGK